MFMFDPPARALEAGKDNNVLPRERTGIAH
jgi:hypothetical protein